MNIKPFDIIKRDCEEVFSGSIDLLFGLRNEKVLISGGTGFMGTWLTELISYLNDEHKFNIKLILLSRNANRFGLKAPHLATRKDIIIIEKDVKNLIEIPDDVTYIIHAAANPDNRLHSSDPLKVMGDISRGTDAVLSAAARLSRVKKILNISSGLIYGPQPYDLQKIPETYHGGPDCDSIVSVYSEAKRFAEALCTAYRNQFKLPIVTARPFAFIGPYQLLDKPWAINNFIRDGLAGGAIHILGNENTIRSYMYASDMSFWLLRILLAGTVGLAYNVGSPVGLTLRDLAEKIADKFPQRIEVVCDMPPNKVADKSRFVPDTMFAEKTLGLKLKVNLDEAIKRALAWYML